MDDGSKKRKNFLWSLVKQFNNVYFAYLILIVAKEKIT